MANEIRITYQGSHSTYSVIQLPSSGQVFNGSAFESFSNANIATYDIPHTSLGGDLRGADFPSAITAGTLVRLSHYAMAGSVPAITDLLIAPSKEWTWNGSALVESTSTAAESVTGTQYLSKSFPLHDVVVEGQQIAAPISQFQAVVVEGLRVTSSVAPAPVGAATTTIVIADAPHGEEPTYSISVTLAADGTTTATETGQVPFAAAATAYVYVSEAGGHSDILVEIEYRAADLSSSYGGGTLLASTVISEARFMCANVTTAQVANTYFLSWLAQGQQRVLRSPAGVQARLSSDGLTVASVPDMVLLNDALVVGYRWMDWLVRWLVAHYRLQLDPDVSNRQAALEDIKELKAELLNA